jgi:hypothetical protein
MMEVGLNNALYGRVYYDGESQPGISQLED